MYDINFVRPLLFIFFGLGFAAAAILGLTAVGALALTRLRSLRDELKELMAALERAEKEE